MKKLFIFVLLVCFSCSSWAIKKCQDKDGKWHYGDVAVSECEATNVTTLTERGFIESVDPAPKSPEQLQQDAAQVEAERNEVERLRAIENEKHRLLSIYETEEDIDRALATQLNSVDSNIHVHVAYLKSMDDRLRRLEQKQEEASNPRLKERFAEDIKGANKRVENARQQLVKLKQKRETTITKFKQEKMAYLALKQTN